MRDDKTVTVPFTEFSCGVPPTGDRLQRAHERCGVRPGADRRQRAVSRRARVERLSIGEQTGRALYTVEITIKFLHEVSAADTVTAESRVASYDTKRVRVHSTLKVGDTAVATGDSLYLHVDTERAR